MTGWLIDTSAYVRLPDADDAEGWSNKIERGLVRLSTVTRLELGYTARSFEGLRELVTTAPMALMPVEYMRPPIEDRAAEVQVLLAERGYHRAASVADLLVAAAAEAARLTVLHVDRDFELIAEVTGQPTERLAGDWG
ncbi:MAG TPA: PIN domain-containing protein [Iamia sp.]|nr:PIN domain-containing protein [Iamia sp.]